jgi:monothiol glutaredoxin
MGLSDSTKKRIEGLIGSDRVVVFMKGSRRAPQCGFSAQVVQILDAHLPSYATFDVLQDPEVRQGIKEFTNWPTIPQVYVNGEFVGGCDILTELYQSGELETVLAGSGS